MVSNCNFIVVDSAFARLFFLNASHFLCTISEILSDPKKREIYDKYGLEGVENEGGPAAAGGHAGHVAAVLVPVRELH